MTRSPLHLGLTYLARHKLLFAAVLFWRGVWEIVPMQVPLLVGVIVDGLNGKGLRLVGLTWPDAAPAEVLHFAALGLALVAVVYGLSAFAYTVTGARLDRGFVAGLRKAVVEKILLLALDHHQRYGAGALLDRALRDTDRLRGFTELVFTRTPTNVVRAAYPVLMLFLIHPVLALVALAVVPPQWLATWYLQQRLHRATRKSLASHSDLTCALQEHLDGAETVKALNAEAAALDRLHGQADRVEADELAAARVTALVRCATWVFTGAGVALIWWQGGVYVLAATLTLGALVAFTGFAELAYRPFRRFGDIVKTYRAGLASLERIQELLEIPGGVVEVARLPTAPGSLATSATPDAAGHIALRDVWFAYGSQDVLRGVTLDIEAGQLTAVVGPSGAGKSSLLRLIAGLYVPDRGRLLLDGRQLEGAALRPGLAVVPQRPVVFSGTVLDNVRLARPEASPDEVRAACAAAAALAFVERLEGGFEARLGRQGVSLSAGELQRLALARALLLRPRILLLDEPTAALDAASEAAVVQALRGLRGAMTVVLVGHRPEGVRLADQVIVLDGGRVVAQGTHAELLAGSPVHRRLFGTGATADVESA
jgi:ABC-type multidrug transport system fused ATPase/permease subunit